MKQRPWNGVHWLGLGFMFFHIQRRPRMTPLTVGQVLRHQSAVTNMPPQTYSMVNLIEGILQWKFLLPRCVKLTRTIGYTLTKPTRTIGYTVTKPTRTIGRTAVGDYACARVSCEFYIFLNLISLLCFPDIFSWRIKFVNPFKRPSPNPVLQRLSSTKLFKTLAVVALIIIWFIFKWKFLNKMSNIFLFFSIIVVTYNVFLSWMSLNIWLYHIGLLLNFITLCISVRDMCDLIWGPWCLDCCRFLSLL